MCGGQSATSSLAASSTNSTSTTARLQTKDGICLYLGDISHGTYDAWQAKGIVPGPVPGTTRYDVRQHDHVLDARLGLAKPGKLSPLEEWERSHG
jgi:hypothetical protein